MSPSVSVGGGDGGQSRGVASDTRRRLAGFVGRRSVSRVAAMAAGAGMAGSYFLNWAVTPGYEVSDPKIAAGEMPVLPEFIAVLGVLALVVAAVGWNRWIQRAVVLFGLLATLVAVLVALLLTNGLISNEPDIGLALAVAASELLFAAGLGARVATRDWWRVQMRLPSFESARRGKEMGESNSPAILRAVAGVGGVGMAGSYLLPWVTYELRPSDPTIAASEAGLFPAVVAVLGVVALVVVAAARWTSPAPLTVLLLGGLGTLVSLYVLGLVLGVVNSGTPYIGFGGVRAPASAFAPAIGLILALVGAVLLFAAGLGARVVARR
jgi:hypothetical protein